METSAPPFIAPEKTDPSQESTVAGCLLQAFKLLRTDLLMAGQINGLSETQEKLKDYLDRAQELMGIIERKAFHDQIDNDIKTPKN